MIVIWLLIGGGLAFLGGARVLKTLRERHKSAYERLLEMLKKSGYSRREVFNALDDYRDEVLAEAGIVDIDWEGYFFAMSASVRELFDPIVVVEEQHDPELELEAVQSGLKIYDDAHAGQLAHELRSWTRRLFAIKRITQKEYDQRMIAADFTDPEQETEIK